MAFNKRWATPCLLLAALALLASGVHASQEVSASVDTTPGQQFDTFTFTISPNLPAKSDPVSLNVNQPIITGGGLTLTGWDANSAKGEYLVEYVVNKATIVDSSLIITKSIPSGGVVKIFDTQADSSVQTPVFDFSQMTLTSNLTVELRNSIVTLTDGAVDEPIVLIGSAAYPAAVSDSSSVQVVGMRSTNGGCLMRLSTGATTQGVASISQKSIVTLDDVDATGLSDAALCVDNALVVTSDSLLRISEANLVSAGDRKPQLVLDAETGAITVSSGSMLVVRNVNIVDGAIIGASSGAIMGSALGDNSIISIISIDAADFCSTCSIQGFPITIGDNSYVYAQDWTIGGSATTDYQDNDLGDPVGLTDLRDSEGKCRAALCLPANSNAINANAAECACNCKEGTFPSMCLGKADLANGYESCTDVHCLLCEDRVGTCTQCQTGYTVESGACIATTCNVNGCAQCASNDAEVCEVCSPGYGLVDGRCQRCDVAYCQKCNTDITTCDNCNSGFLITSDKKGCTAADTNCKVTNCAACADGDITRCGTCEQHYGVMSNGQCGKCADSNCLECNGNLNVCTQCASQTTITQYGTCSPGGKCNVANCAYCQSGNTNRCATCASGYLVNQLDGQCVTSDTCLPQNCKKCSAGSVNYCQQCNDHWAPDAQGECVAVKDNNCKVANCHFCLQGYKNICQECMSPYAVTSSGKCGPQGWCKVAYCLECNSNNQNSCKKCFNDFSVQKDGTCYPTSLGAASHATPRALLVAAVAILGTALLGLI